jgi:beta-lactamase class A
MRIIRAALFGVIAAVMSSQPMADTTTTSPSLWKSFDSSLQRKLNTTLTKLGLNKAVKDKKLSVALVDITRLNKPRVAAVNGDEMLYAASLPKIAILLGAFVEIEQGEMKLDTDTRESLTRMIRVSSNADATRMLNRVGKQRLLGMLQSRKFDLYDPKVNGWQGIRQIRGL